MSEVASPVAGKRQQTKLQNRQAILDAAREVFAELGYEAATARDVIRRTGLAPRTGEEESGGRRRPPGEHQPRLRVTTPEMAAVFDEVRAAITQAILRDG